MTTRSRRNVGVDIVLCCCGVFVLELMRAVEVGVFMSQLAWSIVESLAL